MKRLFLFAILSAFTLCLSAQSNQLPSVSDSIASDTTIANIVPENNSQDIKEDVLDEMFIQKHLILLIGFAIVIILLAICFFINYKLSGRLNRHSEIIGKLDNKYDGLKEDLTHNGKSHNSRAFADTLEVSELKKQINELYKIVDELKGASQSAPVLPATARQSKQTNDQQPAKSNVKGKNTTNSNVMQEKGTTIDVQVQADGTFKIANKNAWYEITCSSPTSSTGTFIVKNNDKSATNAMIENRLLMLEPVCEIINQNGSNKIVVIEPGIVEKVGNGWKLSKKAKISIE